MQIDQLHRISWLTHLAGTYSCLPVTIRGPMFLEKSGLQDTSGHHQVSEVPFKCSDHCWTVSYPDPCEHFWFLFWNGLSKSTSWASPCFQRHGWWRSPPPSPWADSTLSHSVIICTDSSFPLSFFFAFLYVCPLLCMHVCMYLNVEARGHPQVLSLGCLT